MKKITLILITLLMLTCFSSAATLKKTIGTVSVSTTIPEGRQITLRYAQDTTNFVKWIVRTENVTLTDETATTITFAMPATDVEIIADDGQLLELSVSIDGELMETTQRYVGESVTVTAVEKEGMPFKEWSITGLTGVDVTSNPLTFTMPNNNVEIVATFGASIVIANSEVPVGAYIEYVPQAMSVKVYEQDTGYGTDDTNTSEYQEFNPSSTTSWRVIYNNDGQLDIVSADAVYATDGNGLYLQGATGYAKAVDTLNNLCSAYVNVTYATSGRSIGCTSDSVGTITTPITWDYTYTQGNTGLPYTDTYYSADVNQLKNNSLLHSSGSTWLASRRLGALSSYSSFDGRLLLTGGSLPSVALYRELSDGDADEYLVAKAVRPVVSLTSDIQIVGGTGVADDPYKIEVASGCAHNFSLVCDENGETDTIQCSNCSYTETKTCRHNYVVTLNKRYISGNSILISEEYSTVIIKAGGCATLETTLPESSAYPSPEGISNITVNGVNIEVSDPKSDPYVFEIDDIKENKMVIVTYYTLSSGGGSD